MSRACECSRGLAFSQVRCPDLRLRNAGAIYGKEKVYGSIPQGGSQFSDIISKLFVVRFVVFMDRVVETVFCTECTGCATAH